ncbi:MAG: 3'-5' exonuclease [Gammaproteobacteria bacterium]
MNLVVVLSDMTTSIPFIKRLFLSRKVRDRLQHDAALKEIYLKYSRLNQKPILKKPIAETRFVVLDTETTGLHAYAGDEIISIAMVEYQGLEATGNEYETLINPLRPVPQESTEIHGLADADVRNAPLLIEVLPDILQFIDKSVLVGHHIQFDFRFLNKNLKRFLGFQLNNPWLDTMLLFLAHQGRLGHYQLEQVAQACRIKIHNRHTAMGDTRATGEIFSYLSRQLCDQKKPVSLLINQQVTDSPGQP